MVVVSEVSETGAAKLLARFGLELGLVASAAPIPGSYWGEPEAGLVGNRLFARGDTPLHSVLHEAGHYVCMSQRRRSRLDRDAGGDDLEESGVCYFQVLLSDALPEMGRERMFRDMDAWGYSFRLGSTRQWFEEDAEDARAWLRERRLIDSEDGVLWKIRR